ALNVSPVNHVGESATEPFSFLEEIRWAAKISKIARKIEELLGKLRLRSRTASQSTSRLDERGMGWQSFKRFRKTWLRGRRCLEDINNFWMAHCPQTTPELYSHLHEELRLHLEEAERVGYGR
ncbi:MAG: hypothetical protein WAK48_23275, partial [Candidatus Acidiferrum sp.]